MRSDYRIRISTSFGLSRSGCTQIVACPLLSHREFQVNHRKFYIDTLFIDASITKLYCWRCKSTRSHKPASCSTVCGHTYFVCYTHCYFCDHHIVDINDMMAGKPLRISLRNFIYSCGSDCRISFESTRSVVQAAFTLAPCHPIGLPSQSELILISLYYILVCVKDIIHSWRRSIKHCWS